MIYFKLLFIYDLNHNLLNYTYNFTNWSTTQDSSIVETGELSSLNIDPEEDAKDLGFNTGEINVIYNFIDYQLDSSPDNLYYISDISSDRTELRLKTNIFENDQIKINNS